MTVLYLHGRNDYFFQTEMADRLREAGTCVHALDMRKYGRSLHYLEPSDTRTTCCRCLTEVGEAI